MASPFVLFDLDNTLYSPESGIMPEMNRRMTIFVSEYFDISAEDAVELRRGMPEVFGTTLQWLRVCHGLTDPEPYLATVHPLDMYNWLKPDPDLRNFILSMPADYVLFTNSPREHAERTLVALGIADLFPRIWDLRQMGYRGKPEREAYLRILGDLGLQAKDTVLVDDNPANLEAFISMGGRVVSADGKNATDWMPELTAVLEK